jgi:polynucleotide 5'-hydroxyl-kinase GRC3/NOL9
MRYLLNCGKTLIVRGPASLRLLSGQATALCAPLRSRKIVVWHERQLPIETSTEAQLEILLGKLGSIFEVDGSTIPSSWYSALDALIEMDEGKVVIVGATDVGKSTLSTFLANGLLQNKISSRIVDGDIGQADVGPPTTVGSSVPSSYLSSLVDLVPSALIFIGDTSPSRVQPKLLNGIRRLLNNRKQSLTIINTDGWVSDPDAIIYKAALIEAVRPDLVLGIAIGGELEPILSRAAAISMQIEAPTTILMRSRRDRREIRAAAYRRFLDGGRARRYSVREIRVKLPYGSPQPELVQPSELRNLVVGLLDSEGYLLQIGVLLSLEEDSAKVYSRHADHLKEIELGYVKLSTAGAELGYLES